ncbi:MAG: hypothetical protein COV59_05535 [Candidatus Magasanikbacteria bacterium CG11_big_fil_rev_8_21_14_0_20_39_34]|uniref:Major facilitator superfamily (MFS) profile domain-containing protein n=1 Tax=Candidatus Magasanikbacteria bacterium CG11_big_fil_rev_8_21_14_0_20_39_34 TaxID=1974653 RepID=A0A2H0N413_9BACT|nr:MAG: hypothetical protein COV59_05535 [Candidatus Magasanikbacteria bacterium CG11_big_fil_rev_8_21_14_0_20_39_34]
MHRTIRVFLGLSFLFYFGISLTTTTYSLFLLSNGLDMLEVNLVNTIFHLSFFFLEIPTGVVADIFGRKVSYLISIFLWGVTAFVYASSDTFWGFALAEFLAAIAGTCASGAFDAWAIDRLSNEGYKGSLSQLLGQKNKLKSLAMLLGGVLGGYLGSVNLALPWMVLGAFMFFKVLLTFFFMQEEWEKKDKEFHLWRSLKETLRASAVYIRKSQSFRQVILWDAAFVFALQAANMQWQPFFLHMLSSLELLSFVKAGIAISLFLGAELLVRLKGRIPARRLIPALLFGIGSLVALCTLSLGWVFSLSTFMVHELLRGMYYPALMAYLNEDMPAKQRATINSVASMIRGLFGALGLVFSGVCAKHLGISSTWMISGGILALLGLFFLKRKPTI